MTPTELAEFRSNARAALLAERTPEGHWVGELSASALSTATALFTLHLHGGHTELVRGGLEWLKANQNADGGWGDTVLSFSNLSTTCLCWAALSIDAEYADVAAKAEAWIADRIQSRSTHPPRSAATSPTGGEVGVIVGFGMLIRNHILCVGKGHASSLEATKRHHTLHLPTCGGGRRASRREGGWNQKSEKRTYALDAMV